MAPVVEGGVGGMKKEMVEEGVSLYDMAWLFVSEAYGEMANERWKALTAGDMYVKMRGKGGVQAVLTAEEGEKYSDLARQKNPSQVVYHVLLRKMESALKTWV